MSGAVKWCDQSEHGGKLKRIVGDFGRALLDMGTGLTNEDHHALLLKDDVLRNAREVVDLLHSEGELMADYLLDQKDIFACAFDAHSPNVSRASGDNLLMNVGSSNKTLGFDVAASYGDLKTSNAFMNELRDTLAARREVQYEAQQSVKVVPSSDQKVSLGL